MQDLSKHLFYRRVLDDCFLCYNSWQLPSSEKSSVGKKIIHSSKGFCYLVSYAKRMLYSAQPTISFVQRHLNTMIVTNFKNLNSIWNIFQEIHHFLVLTEPVIICIYLRTIDRHFCNQGNVRHPTSKLLNLIWSKH